jgi:fermentation-respiration switch protein FrsA (DUF1100 family)
MVYRAEKSEIKIPIDSLELEGILNLPEKFKSLVVFSHGCGSSRFSPRNNYVAEVLQKSGMGTLLFDLLTEEEDRIYENRFDIPLLTKRLIAVTKWIQKKYKKIKIGYFGSSTGAASALFAAAELGDDISAVVSRGGRPDLAMDVLEKVNAPTLLIVGGNDFGVIELNEEAFNKLTVAKEMHIVTGATHLFEEEGALEEVADKAAEWFKDYLK